MGVCYYAILSIILTILRIILPTDVCQFVRRLCGWQQAVHDMLTANVAERVAANIFAKLSFLSTDSQSHCMPCQSALPSTWWLALLSTLGCSAAAGRMKSSTPRARTW